MIPSATDISYFLAVAETQNVRRAAERLRIAQPSLSVAIQRLEGALGVPLIIRFKSGIQLTRAGERFVRKAQSLLAEWDKVCCEAAKDESELRGRYVIGYPLEVGLMALPDALAKILATYPNLEIDLREKTPVQVSEDVVNFKTDFGIVPNPLKHADLVIRHICSDEFRMWVSNRNSPTQDPKSGKAVLIYDPSIFWWFAAVEAEITFARKITTSSLTMAARMVAAGVGIGVLPNIFTGGIICPLPKDVDIHPLPRDFFSLPHEICLIYRQDTQRSSAGRRLAREIEVTYREVLRACPARS
jgi:DNA-binding transcriptional LysR family regulator